jgi:hypothetical protein
LRSETGSDTPDIDPRANYVLRGLSDAVYGRLHSDFEPVHLPRPTELEGANEEVRFVYFPTSGIASIVAMDESGESVDTAMIGREGMTGLAVFLGTYQSLCGRSFKCRSAACGWEPISCARRSCAAARS